jgi:preprotein translocase subunit YajC
MELMILQANGATSSLFMVAGMFLIMYFFMFRPQQKRLQEQKDFIANLKKGDKIVTAGGLHGKIVQVEEHTVQLEINKNTTVKLEKAFIAVEQSKSLQTPTQTIEAPSENA